MMRYVVGVLRELGYRARAHIVAHDAYFKTNWRAVHMACIGAADPQPADFFGIFDCRSPSDNPWFCDQRLDADVRRARSLEGTDLPAANALLRKLDREVTDRAIFLPLDNPYYYDFVSVRVRYVGDPQFGLIVDQASLR